MENIALQNIPQAKLNTTMRDLFIDLIDITMEYTGKGALKSLPTNYGYIFFWYGWLNPKTLKKQLKNYLPKEKLKQIKQTLNKQNPTQLKDQLIDYLFTIVRDHPETIKEGHAETHLATLAPKLKHTTLTQAAKNLKQFTQKIEKMNTYTKKQLQKKNNKPITEIENNFQTIDYITPQQAQEHADEFFWEDECGYMELSHRRLALETQIRIHFKATDTLQQVINRIDKTINPIKPQLTPMYRYGKSQWPF